MNKKKLSIIITVIVAVVAVVAVIGGISINKHNEKKREAQRQEEESKSKALAEELEQAKNDLLAYISDDTYVEDKTTYKDEIQSADNIDRINGIKADYESEVQEIKAEIERKAEEEAARVAAEAARALEEARENAIEEVNGLSNLTDSGKSPFIARIQSANSTDEIDGILTEANEKNDKYAQAVAATKRAHIIGSSTPKVSGGGADTPSSNPNRGSKGEVVDTGGTNGDTVDWDKPLTDEQQNATFR